MCQGTVGMGLDTVTSPWRVVSFWMCWFFFAHLSICTITNQGLGTLDLLFSEGYGDHHLEHETDLL